MGGAGNAAIRDIDPPVIINALDRFYAMEMVAMHFTLAVQNRLEGQALFLLNSELEEKAEEFRGHAQKLAERIGQLGGAITADPSSFVEVSPFESSVSLSQTATPRWARFSPTSWNRSALPLRPTANSLREFETGT